MLYKNTSYSVKTFYGVKFEPGEIKEVDDVINNRWMIKVDKSTLNPAQVQQKPSPEKSEKKVTELAEDSSPKEESKEDLKESKKTSDKKEQKS